MPGALEWSVVRAVCLVYHCCCAVLESLFDQGHWYQSNVEALMGLMAPPFELVEINDP